MNALLRYFYFEFLPKHYAKQVDYDLKELENRVPEDRGKLRDLTGFFDRVGWLGAAGLVDVDYVLGPMQHAMRRVWFATEPLIKRTRESHLPGHLDPVYRLGFEWLFRRSEQADKTQASLLGHRFLCPGLFSKDDIENLKNQMAGDEQAFRKYLGDLSTQGSSELGA